MSSPSLYRRHRPRTFSDVVGQEAVVRTLRSAITRNAVHHAYLFVGSRGTGKTSMAKILAAALNCVNGPTTDPCGTCSACEAIAVGTSLDVVEMDAASNNSVDDIRDLRDSVALAPMSGGYKVYILDEAHMLTPAAWNAFLKTLEEPPPRGEKTEGSAMVEIIFSGLPSFTLIETVRRAWSTSFICAPYNSR